MESEPSFSNEQRQCMKDEKEPSAVQGKVSWLDVGRSYPSSGAEGYLESNDDDRASAHVFVPRHLRLTRTRQGKTQVDDTNEPLLVDKGKSRDVDEIEEDIEKRKTKKIDRHLRWRNTQTFEGTLVDKETFTTLGKFDIDGVFCSDRSIKRKLRESNERTRKCVPGIATERYFYSHPKRKSRKGVKESSGTIWTVLSPQRQATLLAQSQQHPSEVDAWLELGRTDSEMSSRLPLEERWKRRLILLTKGLEYCPKHPSLICAIMEIQELRYSSVEILKMWEMILNSALTGDEVVIEKASEETLELPVDQQTILIKTGVISHSSLVTSALSFLRRSFTLYRMELFIELFKRHTQPLMSQPVLKKLSRFDQQSRIPSVSNSSIDEQQSSPLSILSTTLIITLLASSHWSTVLDILGLIGHADFLISQKMLCGSMDEIKADLMTFWGSHPPRLGHPMATIMYQSLARPSVSPSNHLLLCGTLTAIVEALLPIMVHHSPMLDSSIDIPSTLSIPRWFDIEDQLEDNLFFETPIDEKKIESLGFSTNPNPPVINIDDMQYLILSLVNRPLTSPPYRHIFSILLFPFAFACNSSRFCSSSVDDFLSLAGLLRAVAHGLQRCQLLKWSPLDLDIPQLIRSASTERQSDLPSQSQDPSSIPAPDSPIPMNDIFGFDVTMTVKTELAPFVQSLLNLHQSMYQSSLFSFQLFINKFNHQIYIQQFPSLVYACMVALQILIWNPNDTFLIHSVVSTLAYIGQSKLARRLLKLFESSSLLWLSYATFSFASNPNTESHLSIRSLLTKFVIASNLTSIEFVIGWIRFECIAIIHLINSTYFHSTTKPVLVIPLICHLLCCCAEQSFQPWASLCQEGKTSTSSVDVWDSLQFPTRLRMKSALSRLNDQLAQASLPPTDRCFLSCGPFLSILLACSILVVVIENPEQGWNRLHSGLPPKDAKVWDDPVNAHSLEMTLDLFLLIISSSSHCPSCSGWTLNSVQSLCLITLDYFPSHTRAMEILSRFHCHRSTLLKLRASLSFNSYGKSRIPTGSLKGFLISELSSGYPSFRRLENLFEKNLSIPLTQFQSNTSVWNLYLGFLLVCLVFKDSFITALPSNIEGNTTVEQFLFDKFRSVTQRARVDSPWSKKLWIHSLASLSQSVRSINNDVSNGLEQEHSDHSVEAFLGDVESLIGKGVIVRLDPLELIT